jgi:hypothetical protein
METKAKQSYDEQPNPPTTEENVRLQSLAAANTLWACLAREVAYGENDSETSVADKIEAVEATIAGKANTSHTHTYGDISGLSVVASTGSYSSLSGTPDLAEVATSGDYNDLTNKPAEYVHPATHPASMITGLSDVATIIPKKKPNGGTWDGKTFHCDVPRYYGSNTSDVDTERRVIKTLYIYNNKIVGHVVNDKDERTDVVLRAVYEI